MKFVVTLDRDEAEMVVAECPAIPGCISQGATEDEAMCNIREAISLCLESRAEAGMPLTVAVREVEVVASMPKLPGISGADAMGACAGNVAVVDS